MDAAAGGAGPVAVQLLDSFALRLDSDPVNSECASSIKGRDQ